jgi:hypothetical protein
MADAVGVQDRLALAFQAPEPIHLVLVEIETEDVEVLRHPRRLR